MRLGLVGMGLGCWSAMAGMAFAEPVSGGQAQGLLFEAGAAQVQFVKGSPLSESEVKLMSLALSGQPYFGAIAVSPDEKLLESKATMAVANFHSTEAASAAALRECEKLRTGAAPCVIVALIRPKGWDKRPLTLSSEATAGFGSDYPAAQGALAASRSSGAWAIAKGAKSADAAMAACQKKAADKDCALVVVD